MKNVGMASCFGIAGGSVITVSPVLPKSVIPELNATLRARFAHLIDGAAVK